MSNIEKGPNEKVCEAFLGELKELLAKYNAFIYMDRDNDDNPCISIWAKTVKGDQPMVVTTDSCSISESKNYLIDPNLNIIWKKDRIFPKRDSDGKVSRDEYGNVIEPGRIIKFTGKVKDIDREYSESIFEIIPEKEGEGTEYSHTYGRWIPYCFGKQIGSAKPSILDVQYDCLRYLEENWEEISKKITVEED